MSPRARHADAGEMAPRVGAVTTVVRLSVIVPTYNEAGNIPALLRRIEAAVVGKAIPTEVWIMDDRSPDGTGEAARAVRTSLKVHVVERDGERGLAQAATEGLRRANGEFVMVMDADLQHPPESIPEMVSALEAGADFVIGSRFIGGGRATRFNLLRRLNSWGATLLSRPLLPTQIADPMSGFFAMRRARLKDIRFHATGYKIGLELLVKSRPAKVREVPIIFGARHAGQSKLSLGQQYLYLNHLNRLYAWRFPAIHQFARFCAIGTCGMAVDLSLMWALLAAGQPFGSARIWSILTALLFNFILNRRFTFPEGKTPAVGQFLRFAGACSIGTVINWTVSNGLYRLFPTLRGAVPLFCAVGVVAGTFANFLLSKRYAFAKPTGGR